MKCLIPVCGGLLLLLGTGCASIQTEDVVNQHSEEIASLRADVNTLAEDRQRMINQLEAQRQEAAQVNLQVRQLQERLDLAEKQVAAGDATYRQKLQDLQRTITAESRLRETAIQDVVKAVSQEVASKTNEIQEQQQQLMKSLAAAAKAAEAAAPQYEYVVQKGDTLAAIAKAAGVPVTSLQKANGLKGTILPVGMKLVIPKK